MKPDYSSELLALGLRLELRDALESRNETENNTP